MINFENIKRVNDMTCKTIDEKVNRNLSYNDNSESGTESSENNNEENEKEKQDKIKKENNDKSLKMLVSLVENALILTDTIKEDLMKEKIELIIEECNDNKTNDLLKANF